MFRTMINSVIRNVAASRFGPQPNTVALQWTPKYITSVVFNSAPQQIRTFTLLNSPNRFLAGIKPVELPQTQPPLHLYQPNRTVTKFSLKKGKRKTVKAAVRRFKRLDWGGWIRTHCGRNKKMWKKTGKLKRRLRQHVFVNATQSWLLDKMVTKFWRRPKNYVDDPYEPYHSREEYFATAKKPVKF